MAASDARWPPLKNTAWRVTFPLLDADGDPVANGAGDTPDCERSIDSGNFADCSNEMVEIETDSGIYYLDLNASEMNGDCIAIICKTATAGTKTTPIVVYPVSAGFNELSTDHDKTQSDIALIDAAIDSDALLADADHDKTQSDILLLSGKADSDQLLNLADHDKTQSDILLVDGAIDSDHTITMSDIAAISTKVDSDAVLADADHDKTQSDILLIDGAIDSDHTVTTTAITAVGTKIDSDVVVADAKIDSDMALLLGDHDKTQSDILLLSDKADSDQVISLSDIAALATKADSDAVLADADHDKTQSDILLIDGAIDSDHTITMSDIAAVSTKVDSDAVLAGADHDKTQSDIVLVQTDTTKTLSDMVVNQALIDADHDKTQSDLAIITGTAGVELGTSQTAAWASQLEASAGTIKEGVAKAGTLSTTQMSTTLAEANDVFNGRVLIFKADTDTVALRLQATDITDFVNVNGVLTFTAVTVAPAATETFIIV